MIPRATYRLQFHKGFGFADAIPLAPYLAKLGVSHVYASPIGTARTGSMHGYDQVDPTRINPELGGEDGFHALVAALRAQAMGVILDIVPNHMAVGKADNRWWLDVLEHGPQSAHADLFDIDWTPADPALDGKLLAPFLGSPYAQALAAGDVRLARNDRTGEYAVWAYDTHKFPLRPHDQESLLAEGDVCQRHDAKSPEGYRRLHALLERQAYRLAWWKTAGDEINWRRFFDITELAGVKVERDEVFDLMHELPIRLYREGLIDGVRVDHVDGLADPAGYCRRLRQALEGARPPGSTGRTDDQAYIVVEKILAQGERLSPEWLTDGTTGYDYMNEAATLLHDSAGADALTHLWVEISGRSGEFETEERQARLETLRRAFSGQLEAAVRSFHQVARSDLSTRDLTAGMLRRALTTLLSVFSAYRTYGLGDTAPATDAPMLAYALDRARSFVAPGESVVLERLAAWLAGEGPGEPQLRSTAVRRFQQLSAPVAAKAVEDTAFYRYGRLLSRDDVGSDPARLATSLADAHAANSQRRTNFPNAMLTTATHDHKRGEDVRARLAVISEGPERWRARVRLWSELNAGIATSVDPLDLYPLYQTLVGAWPLGLTPTDRDGLATFADRVGGWWRKALREAKLNSSWAAPDEDYEAACKRFLEAALDPERSLDFLRDLVGYVDEIAPAGAANGLVQALLRCTSPGVPDLYQGAEGWDLSLVDPDNRRPVDYAWRIASLNTPANWSDLRRAWRDGRVKQRLIATALQFRRQHADLMSRGDYVPLQEEGGGTGRVFAFLRTLGSEAVLVAVALNVSSELDAQDLALSATWAAGRRLPLPADGPWRHGFNSFTSKRLVIDRGGFQVSQIFDSGPAVLLELKAE